MTEFSSDFIVHLAEETQIFSAECGDAQRERSTECMEPLNGFVTEITATLADVWDKDQKQKVARLINRTCTNYENAMVCAKPHLKPPCTSGNCYVKVLGAMCVEKRKIYGNLDCVGRVLSSLNVTSCLNPQTTASNLMELLTEPQKLRQYAGRLNFCLIEPLVENCGQTGANIVNKLLLLAQKFPNNTECQLTPATSAAELHETPSHRARPSEPRQQIVLSAKPVGETPQNPLQPVAEPAKLPNVTATTSSLPQGRTANNSTVKSGAVGISRISSLSCLLTAIIGIVRLTS